MMPERISFELTNGERLDRLASLIAAIGQAKADNDFHDDAYWEQHLDEQSRAAFWWPTRAEIEAWQALWFSTPPERRAVDPMLQTPWEFGSLIDAARQAELTYIRLNRLGRGGAIEFEPSAWPYGGTDWMHALIEAFGGRITHEAA